MLPQPALRPELARVLLIEDEPILRFCAAEELRDNGFTVIEAKNADLAKKFFDTGSPFDLIFSDIRMPGSMSGLEFARYAQSARPDLPVILTSASNYKIDGIQNAKILLPKPYDLNQVVDLVFKILSLSR